MARYTIDGRWCGDTAADAYTDIVATALANRYPNKRKFLLLEDNDPTGNRSRKGLDAKAAAKMEVFEIPKRSPDLNVLDYAVWSEVERRMRAQERKWPASRRESRAQFEKRLDRTAKSLPAAFIDKCVSSMKVRCQQLYDAEGGLFEEGGRRSRRPL